MLHVQLVCGRIRYEFALSWVSTSAVCKRCDAHPVLSNPAAAPKKAFERELLHPSPRRSVEVRRTNSDARVPATAAHDMTSRFHTRHHHCPRAAG